VTPGDALGPRPSPAARQVLDALAKDYEDRVLGLAMGRAAAFRDVDELSTVDIVRASEDVYAGRGNRLRRYDRLIVLYLGFGASVAAASIVLLLLVTVGSPSDVVQLLLAVAGVAGALVAGFGAGISSLRARREEGGMVPLRGRGVDDLDGWLLAHWIELEVATRDAVAERLGESQAGEPLSLLIDRLAEVDLLSSGDVASFRRVLSVRNQVAHRPGSVSWERLEAASKDLDELLREFRRRRIVYP
jgi:hypothetical protein